MPRSIPSLKQTRRRGQALLFLVMAVTILAFVLLWNVDLHRIIALKTRSQHGGDAAALAAARWQASTLNLIGELNLMQALALSTGDTDASEIINSIQARLAFTGPMVGLIAAQVAAKNNRLYEIPDFSALIREHADEVRFSYSATFGGEMVFPEPYPGAWNDYADMLDTAANHGIAAGPDNAQFLNDRVGDHVLLDSGFYEAIAGQNWCWFYLHQSGLLEAYSDYTWWSDLPPINPPSTHNSEIFSLGLQPHLMHLSSMIESEDLLAAAGPDIPMPGFDADQADELEAVWYLYDDQKWGPWSAMSTSGPDPFPATGPVRPQFDYAGADVAVRVLTETDRFFVPADSADNGGSLTWTAAAKPFGWLGDDLRPNAYGLVLPAFREVRLIPVDASSAPDAGSFDLEWRHHVGEHLPLYMQFGPSNASCWYCAQLQTWENPDFRQQGIDWLSVFNHLCTITPGGGGGGQGGGRRRGH